MKQKEELQNLKNEVERIPRLEVRVEDGVLIFDDLNDKKLLPKLLKRYIITMSKNYSDIVVDFISTES